jgi:hypothetical protein
MRRIISASSLIILTSAIIIGCVEPMPKGRSIVLAADEGAKLTHPCSRKGAPSYEATWAPTPSDVQTLELLLPKVKNLRTPWGSRIDSLDGYCFQYFGLVANGKKLIYINAYACADDGMQASPTVAKYCDGGTMFWGALYDPAIGEFSDLQVNGIA